jgi:DNA methylase
MASPNEWLQTKMLSRAYTHRNGDTVEFNEPRNEYYIKHPEMMLGADTSRVDRWGNGETYIDGSERDLTTSLQNAIENLPKDIYQTEQIESGPQSMDDIIPAPSFVKENAFYIGDDNKLYQSLGGAAHLVPDVLGKDYTHGDRIRRFVAMSMKRRELLRAQLADESDEVVTKLQKELSVLYDGFVKKYGFINGPLTTEKGPKQQTGPCLRSTPTPLLLLPWKSGMKRKKSLRKKTFLHRGFSLVLQYQPT